MRVYVNNNTAICIAENDVFRERNKHIEVDNHIVRKKLEANIFVAKHVASGHQLANFLTKPLGRTRVDFICDKLECWICMIYMLQLEGGSVEKDTI